MKCYKKCRALVLAFVVCLVVILSPVSILAGTNRYLTCSPYYGYVGDRVDIYGTDWDQATSYTITFAYGTTLAKDVATGAIYSSGIIATYFNVPEYPQGVYTVHARSVLNETHSDSFRIDPWITLDKLSDYVGNAVTVSGTGFAASKSVTLYFDDVSVVTASTNSLGSFSNASLTVPESYWGSHTIKVTDASSNSGTATFDTKQSVIIDPTLGSAGDTVTVNGYGFIANTTITITFGSVDTATVVSDSNGSFSASLNVPTVASGTHEVKASDSTNTASKVFTVSPSVELSPVEGYTGTEVIVSGSGFRANQLISISFDGGDPIATIDSTADGRFSSNFNVPVRGAGDYIVSVSDTVNIKEVSFSILTSVSIDRVTGNVGDPLMVSGVGFTSGKTVTIKYDDTPVASSAVLADGTFSAEFDAPPSRSGEHTILVNDGGINNIPLIFSMESVAPSNPKLLKPETDIKAKAGAYFDWEDVTDLSGVTYILQIATDENFTEDSLVLKKSGLSQSEYTLTGEEKLKSVKQEDPYYWRVKVIDGAYNESAWSEINSFYVGSFLSLPSLSQWVRYVIFGIGALALFFLGFWLGRRTAYF
ncbi:hypothetical protein ACFLT8_03120 [Chloroflexota bacterium]